MDNYTPIIVAIIIALVVLYIYTDYQDGRRQPRHQRSQRSQIKDRSQIKELSEKEQKKKEMEDKYGFPPSTPFGNYALNPLNFDPYIGYYYNPHGGFGYPKGYNVVPARDFGGRYRSHRYFS